MKRDLVMLIAIGGREAHFTWGKEVATSMLTVLEQAESLRLNALGQA